jgi:hypothetical protein
MQKTKNSSACGLAPRPEGRRRAEPGGPRADAQILRYVRRFVNLDDNCDKQGHTLGVAGSIQPLMHVDRWSAPRPRRSKQRARFAA